MAELMKLVCRRCGYVLKVGNRDIDLPVHTCRDILEGRLIRRDIRNTIQLKKLGLCPGASYMFCERLPAYKVLRESKGE